MPRRGTVPKREVLPDPLYNSALVTKFINSMMYGGKRATSQQIMYGALDHGPVQDPGRPAEGLQEGLGKRAPPLEVKSRRVGGATYQVPIEISFERRRSLALRWIVDAGRRPQGHDDEEELAAEIIDAYKIRGGVVKKKEDTHKMAQANRAFAHLRW